VTLAAAVICSTARRARETWDLASRTLGAEPAVRYEPRVYEATVLALLSESAADAQNGYGGGLSPQTVMTRYGEQSAVFQTWTRSTWIGTAARRTSGKVFALTSGAHELLVTGWRGTLSGGEQRALRGLFYAATGGAARALARPLPMRISPRTRQPPSSSIRPRHRRLSRRQ